MISTLQELRIPKVYRIGFQTGGVLSAHYTAGGNNFLRLTTRSL
ncbi:MAG: hypothetical protein ABSE95_11350 [Thermodesulfobacteriota bacterium]|jgi:hypothetical protein